MLGRRAGGRHRPPHQAEHPLQQAEQHRNTQVGLEQKHSDDKDDDDADDEADDINDDYGHDDDAEADDVDGDDQAR